MNIKKRLYYFICSILLIPLFFLLGLAVVFFGLILPILVLISPKPIITKNCEIEFDFDDEDDDDEE